MSGSESFLPINLDRFLVRTKTMRNEMFQTCNGTQLLVIYVHEQRVHEGPELHRCEHISWWFPDAGRPPVCVRDAGGLGASRCQGDP